MRALTYGLRARGHQVSVIARAARRTPAQEGVSRWLTPRNQIIGAAYWGVTARLSATFGRFDVIHCHGLDGYILASQPLQPSPTVVHVHNTPIPDPGFYNVIEHKTGLAVMAEALRRADGIIIPTLAAKERLLMDMPSLARDKVEVVPNLIDTGYFNPEVVARERTSPLSEQDIVVLYFGKIKESKGIEDICKAAEALRNLRIKLVVAGAPTATSRFLDYLKASYPGVVFTGRVPDPRVYYRCADIFCIYTNGFEGGETFSIALAEAMAMGLPVVCSDNPIYREVTHGNALFVRNRDPYALSEALAMLASNQSFRSEMGTKGREVALDNYSTEEVIPEVESIYSAVMHR